MKKGFGFVELNKEGMNLVNVTWPGPFKVIDLDPHFGVEILDHRNISHWIMTGNFSFMEDHTITDVLYLNNTQTIVDRIIQKMGEEHKERITTCKRSYLQTFSGQDGHVHDVQAYEERIEKALAIINDLPQSVYHMQEIDDIRHILKGKPTEKDDAEQTFVL